jgi:hypothetical protein
MDAIKCSIFSYFLTYWSKFWYQYYYKKKALWQWYQIINTMVNIFSSSSCISNNSKKIEIKIAATSLRAYLILLLIRRVTREKTTMDILTKIRPRHWYIGYFLKQKLYSFRMVESKFIAEQLTKFKQNYRWFMEYLSEIWWWG